uniref:Uncharacterized protein n=1 Tax=Vespula pensylvanica TaxID=30213 RepID=A0A834JYJ7_VESPE|nr:hypothetical protein H0235_016550 [Vespula pensylvanica]
MNLATTVTTIKILIKLEYDKLDDRKFLLQIVLSRTTLVRCPDAGWAGPRPFEGLHRASPTIEFCQEPQDPNYMAVGPHKFARRRHTPPLSCRCSFVALL